MLASLRRSICVANVPRSATAGLAICLGLTWFALSALAQSGNPGSPRRDGQPVRTAQREPAQREPAGPQEYVPRDIPRQNNPAIPNVPVVPKPPFAALTPEHQKYLDDILIYWEQSSSSIERYTCNFERWEYDAVFGPRNTYKTYSKGEIAYAAPDKGMFKVVTIKDYTPPKAEGEKPKYVERAKDSPKDAFEHWICDGQSVFEHDYVKKKLIERQLPPDLRGKAIVDGPLPFLFGAKADKIKERYWVRVITPDDAKGEYWLEAYPKSRADAANYKKVEVIIDEKDFLPKAIQVFNVEYDERKNPARAVFMFSDRKKNAIILDPLEIFFKKFYRPSTPKNWEKIVEKYPLDEPPLSAVPPKGNQAKAPGGRPLK